MGKLIAILEDDPRRIESMCELLSTHYNSFDIAQFDNAPQMIEFLDSHLSDVKLISLDHDLIPDINVYGENFDPGTGRDVANYLAQNEPICPIILHTTNYIARDGMYFELEAKGWECLVVIPHDDLEWIAKEWADTIEKVI